MNNEEKINQRNLESRHMNSTINVLKLMKSILETSGCWNRGAYAQNRRGQTVSAFSNDAVSWSILGVNSYATWVLGLDASWDRKRNERWQAYCMSKVYIMRAISDLWPDFEKKTEVVDKWDYADDLIQVFNDDPEVSLCNVTDVMNRAIDHAEEGLRSCARHLISTAQDLTVVRVKEKRKSEDTGN